MQEKINDSEYKFVTPIDGLFDDNYKREQPSVKNQRFFLFSMKIINKIFLNFLKIIEYIVGKKIYFSKEDISPDISSRTKELAVNLFQKNIIKKLIKKERVHCDEPYFPNYVSILYAFEGDISVCSDGIGISSGSCGGADFTEEKALMRALGESAERFCLLSYRNKNLILSQYDKISKNALNPLSFAGISPDQRKQNSLFNINKDSIFRWVRGFSLPDHKSILIPAQTVYVGYKNHPQEPIIRDQISTGAAAADSIDGAFYRGVCETVERDAFMISYLNNFSLPLIDLETVKTDDKEFRHFLTMLKRYNLEVYVVDLTTDIKIPSTAAFIIDRTGVGPAVIAGFAARLNIEESIENSIIEAVYSRLNFREIGSPSNPKWERKVKILKDDIRRIKTIKDRTFFWSPKEMVGRIEPFFKGPLKKISEEEKNKYKNISVKDKSKIAVNMLKERGVDVYGADITLPQIKEEGIFVAKIIAPKLHPLYLNEGLKHTWGERIFNVPVSLGYRKEPSSPKNFNNMPHPGL